MRILREPEVRALHDLAERLEERGMHAEGMALREILQSQPARHEVRASVVAEVVHMPVDTVRGWIRRGIVPGRIDESGEAFVDFEAFESVLALDAALPYADPSSPDVSEDDILAEIAAVRAEQHRQ